MSFEISQISHELIPPGFLTFPGAFVLCVHDENGVYHAPRQSRGGVICHLSLIDAVIELAHLRRLGESYHLASAALVDRSAFLDEEGVGYIAHVHLGWPAHDRKLLTRPSGPLASYCRTLHVTSAPSPPSIFQIHEGILREVTRVRELAGMFAWEETIAQTLDWDLGQMERIAECALTTIEIERGQALRMTHIALFDAEFEQWHYVPVNDDRQPLALRGA
jgi:hypothetical protein